VKTRNLKWASRSRSQPQSSPSRLKVQLILSNLFKAVKSESDYSRVTQAILGLLVSNLFLSVALGVAMKRVWTLINTLQILTHVPLLELPLTFPHNAKMFMKALYDISNVKLISKSQIIRWIGVFL